MAEIYLLLGNDSFTKQEFLNSLQAQKQLAVVRFEESLTPEEVLKDALTASLFAKKQIFVASDFVAKNQLPEEYLAALAQSPHTLVFLEEKLDKRKTETKKILADKNLTFQEFTIPSGLEFKKWVEARTKKYNLKLSGRALELFLQRLGAGEGGIGEDLYDLWQADSELQKLKTFAGDTPLPVEDVAALVSENISDDIFKITNAITDGNKALAIKLLNNYMDRLGGIDEKTKIIGLYASLAEQFRGIYVIQTFVAEGMPDAEIAKAASFTPGKVFVYKKLAQKFSSKKVLEILAKFELLDQEIKTSQNPAALQFLMILLSAMK